MITAEELEKLAELKDKGIITEEEFNVKRDEFLKQNFGPANKFGDTNALSDAKSFLIKGINLLIKGDNKKGSLVREKQSLHKHSFFKFILGGLAVIGLLSYCSGGSVVGEKFCGIYARADSTFEGLLFSPEAVDEGIFLRFPTKEVAKKWDMYDRQRICVSGSIREEPTSPGYYYIYNPRFMGYQ